MRGWRLRHLLLRMVLRQGAPGLRMALPRAPELRGPGGPGMLPSDLHPLLSPRVSFQVAAQWLDAYVTHGDTPPSHAVITFPMLLFVPLYFLTPSPFSPGPPTSPVRQPSVL